MTDRGLPIVDGAPACPFVAFEDDRDERATSPDHRHRCYAETRPAPRALAHQEAYCLASAFPVCPTFQDWARREAARARTGAADARAGGSEADAGRKPSRGWAAPPLWGSSAGGRGEDGDDDDVASAEIAAISTEGVAGPDFLARRSGPDAGLAGSAADLLAGGRAEPAGATPRAEGPSPVVDRPRASGESPPSSVAAPNPVAPAAAAAASGTAAGQSGTGAPPAATPAAAAASEARAERESLGLSGRNSLDDDDFDDDWEDEPAPARPDRSERGAAAVTAGGGASSGRRPKVGDTRRRREPDVGPSWERPRRYEAYPTLRTRMGLARLPSMSRLAAMALALVIAALALFFLPALFVGRPSDEGPGVGASVAPSVAPSVAVSPTPTPAPSPTVYVVQPGDTLSRIAAQFNISLADLIEANRETLPDPDRLAIGDQLVIPQPLPDEVPGGSVDPSASLEIP